MRFLLHVYELSHSTWPAESRRRERNGENFKAEWMIVDAQCPTQYDLSIDAHVHTNTNTHIFSFACMLYYIYYIWRLSDDATAVVRRRRRGSIKCIGERRDPRRSTILHRWMRTRCCSRAITLCLRASAGVDGGVLKSNKLCMLSVLPSPSVDADALVVLILTMMVFSTTGSARMCARRLGFYT